MKRKLGALGLMMTVSVVCLAEADGGKVYQLDMFSLISFGLAITALVVSLFMGWLSWEFYKQSKTASDKTTETVTRIETLVSGIQSNITEIVQRTVSYWIESGGGDGHVDQSKREVYERINELEAAIQKGGVGNTDSLLQDVSALKNQLDELGRGIRESQIKALFPGITDGSPAVRYTQEVTNADSNEQTGIIRVNVLRPTTIATATIRFSPVFLSEPMLTAKLVTSPYEDPSQISAKPGSPSQKACNVHLNCGNPLRTGEYVFEYSAKVSA